MTLQSNYLPISDNSRLHAALLGGTLMLTLEACPRCAPSLQPRYSAGGVAHVLFSVSVGSSALLTDLLARMNDGGMPTRDISGIEAAQVLF